MTEDLAREVEQLRADIAELRARNARVDQEKGWEKSWSRRLVITAVTWFGAWLWLRNLGAENAALQALVPSGGYAISNLSLPVLRRWWLERYRGR
jgi:hypothetical protein